MYLILQAQKCLRSQLQLQICLGASTVTLLVYCPTASFREFSLLNLWSSSFITAGSCFFLCFDIVLVVIEPILSNATCTQVPTTQDPLIYLFILKTYDCWNLHFLNQHNLNDDSSLREDQVSKSTHVRKLVYVPDSYCQNDDFGPKGSQVIKSDCWISDLGWGKMKSPSSIVI